MPDQPREPTAEETSTQLFVGFHEDGNVETCGEQPHNPTDVAYVPLTEANDLREIVEILKQSRREWKQKYSTAVAAERERCASVDVLLVACEKCNVEVGQFCVDYRKGQVQPHVARWRAAIRKGGDDG